ncbi:MAG: VOC family protein [Nitrospirota bacterium]|jgi:catechol 2,3-dioxygenase-like lactoylglutathione lyase family enzyme
MADPSPTESAPAIEALSAVTLATGDMRRTVRFYRALGFELLYGGEAATFTSFRVGGGFLNLIAQPPAPAGCWWGRVIFHVADVDALYRTAVALGLTPEAPPRDASWGERYFHLRDPDGHELSFARPIARE